MSRRVRRRMAGDMSSDPSRRPRLLVVDDEPEVVELMVEFAGRAGYDVISTSRPDEFDSLYDDFLDVVVLDLWMPGIDGIELVRRLAARRSQARLILMSGFDERVLDSARQLATSQGLRVLGTLPKPIRLAQLTGLLDAERGVAPSAAAHAFEITVAELRRAFEKATRHVAALSGISYLSISVHLPATALTDVQFPDLVVDQLRGTGLEP